VDHQIISQIPQQESSLWVSIPSGCTMFEAPWNLSTAHIWISYIHTITEITMPLNKVGAVLGQMATTFGIAHLEEQLAWVLVPSLTNVSAVDIQHTLGTYLKSLSHKTIASCRKEEKQLAISNKALMMMSLQLQWWLTLAGASMLKSICTMLNQELPLS